MIKLERKLGLWSCISIVVGAVIGSSIFMKPAIMATQLGSPLLLLLVWVLAGVVSLFGGMINAEIGSVMPETGGQFVYFRYMYGKFFAYLYGWAGFIVINTGAIAGIAFVFAQYSGYFIELPQVSAAVEQSVQLHIPFVGTFYLLQNIGTKAVAILLVVVITFINSRSLKAGGAVQVFFSVLKVAALIFLVGAIFFSGKGDVHNLTAVSTGFDPSAWGMILGFTAATTGALAAYDGWNNLGFVAGEISDPQKNIPRGLIFGIGVCIILYVLTTEAYLYVLPIDALKNSGLVASDALNKVMLAGGAFVALMVMVSTAGGTNGNILPCARVTYAMSLEKSFFAFTGKVNPKYHTPSNALWLQAAWASILVVIGSFDMLMDMFVFITWIFYAFMAYGIFIFRRKMPDAERPYKMKGYPYLPIIFIAFSSLYIIFTLYNDINNYCNHQSTVINSVLGLVLTAAGIPLYWVFKRGRDLPSA